MSKREPSPDGRYRRSSDLITREVLDETLLVPVRGEIAQLQKIFVLNPAGAFVWEHLDGEHTLAEVHAKMLESYDVTHDEAWQDLLEIVAALEQAGLIDPEAERSAADGTTPGP